MLIYSKVRIHFDIEVGMKKMAITNKTLLQSLPNAEMCKKIPVLLEKHYGIQMANIWKFGINTGLRLSEMLTIKLENISGKKALITINKTRNDEMQEIFLPSEARELINSIRKAHPGSKYLFQSYRSRNVINKKSTPVTRQAVSLAFRGVGEILGIPLSPHMMRQIHIVQSIDQLDPSERKLIEFYLT